MKILFCTYDMPGFKAGGINSWMQRLIPDLVNNHKLDITTLFLYYGDFKSCPTVNFFKENELKISAFSLDKIKYTENRVKKILKIVKAKNINVLITNNVVAALYTHKYLQKFNIPVIPILHSNDAFTKGVISKFINISQDGIKNSVSVSERINSHIIDRSSNHKVIACGTPVLNIYATIPKNCLKIIYAGRLEVEAKQIILLTKSFINISKKYNEFEFYIYGNGSKQKEVISLIEKNKPNKVFYMGAVNPSEIINIISQHHVFTLMSDYEGMPIAVMEAMACGVVPVCLYEESGINELIDNGVNGFVVNDRNEDYEKRLLQLANNPELWQELSKNSIYKIKQKYSAEKTNNSWANFLLSLKNNTPIEFKIPSKIELDSDLLLYNDNRKPNVSKRIRIEIKDIFMRFRMIVRPRARLRKFKKDCNCFIGRVVKKIPDSYE